MHDPTEHVQEHLTHEAAHGGHDEHGHGHGPRWITAAALTAAILAAFAAVSGALSTSYLTRSTLSRIASNDTWNEYGQKSIKNSNIDTRNFEYSLAQWVAALPGASGVKIPDTVEKLHKGDLAKKAEYNTAEVKDSLPFLSKRAGEEEALSDKNLDAHELFEFAATMFHIAIAVVAIAVVAKRKEFWYMSMICGAVGAVIFFVALHSAPPAPKEKTAEAETTSHAPLPGDHAAPGGDHAAVGEGGAGKGEAAGAASRGAASPAGATGEH